MTPTSPYIAKRATAQPQGIDPSVLRAAQAIAARRSWIPGSGQPQVAPQNPYMANENAPSLRGLSPMGRFNDMKARRQALYANLVPQGQVVQDSATVPVNAAQLADQALDVQSGIGRGTDATGAATAVTPLGGVVTTSPPSEGPNPFQSRILNSRFGSGMSIDKGVPGGPGNFGIPMAGGTMENVPMSIYRTPQARALEDQQASVKASGATPFDDLDFADMLGKLKAANKKT